MGTGAMFSPPDVIMSSEIHSMETLSGHLLHCMLYTTFLPPSDVKEAILVHLPYVPRMEPTIIIDGLLGFLFIVEVAHKHMTAIITDL